MDEVTRKDHEGAAPEPARPGTGGPATEGRREAPGDPRRERRTAAPRVPKRRRGVAVNDPIADMLTRLRNGVRARKDSVDIPASRTKADIARILKEQGFIAGYEASPTSLVLKLKYLGGKESALVGVRRVSRPGLRVYSTRREMPLVMGGMGVSIVSTSAGLMTGREAQRRGLGGEILAQVW